MICNVVPVPTYVPAQASSGIVVCFLLRRFFICDLVRFRGGVVAATVCCGDRVAVLCLVRLVGCHVFIPSLLITHFFAWLLLRLPVVKGQASVWASARAASSSGSVFVASKWPWASVAARAWPNSDASPSLHFHDGVLVGVIRRFF